MIPLGRRPLAWPATIAMIAVGVTGCAAHAAALATRQPRRRVARDRWQDRPEPKAGTRAAQAAQGAKLFRQKCSVCHGAKLQGGAGPQLVGNQFFFRFGGKPVSQLWNDVHTEMPLNAPASMSNADSLAVVAFILQQNGFPGGRVGDHRPLRHVAPHSKSRAECSNGGRRRTAPAATPMVVRAAFEQHSDATRARRGPTPTPTTGWRTERAIAARVTRRWRSISTKNVAQLKPRVLRRTRAGRLL